jgi:hypothetical protein
MTTTALPTTTRNAASSAAFRVPATRSASGTRRLLAAGLVAGPVYVTTSLVQALTREGFDLTRHAWSTLANGDLGWIQRSNLALTGALLVVFALGLRRVLTEGPGRRWAPRGFIVFGVGMMVASVFAADPSLGFPVGTPEDYRGLSAEGIGHMFSASTGFVGAMIGCFALARRFGSVGERGWALGSRLVGVSFIASFVGLSGTGSSAGVIAFTVSMVAVFSWIAVVGRRFQRSAADA